jgi:hypothetical protein
MSIATNTVKYRIDTILCHAPGRMPVMERGDFTRRFISITNLTEWTCHRESGIE